MKNNTIKYFLLAITLFVSGFIVSPDNTKAAERILEPGSTELTANWFYYTGNSARAKWYRGETSSTLSNYYNELKAVNPNLFYGNSRKLFREQYLGEYTWFTIHMPEQVISDSRITDMSYMMENRQTTFGRTGDKLVTSGDRTYTNIALNQLPYRYNLKQGSITKWGAYNGYNSGQKRILAGTFYNKRFEWRYLGYAVNGEPIHNPYFPDDYPALYASKTEIGMQTYWRQKNWYTNPWTNGLYQKVYLSSSRPEHATTQNMQTYFLNEYPEFKKTNPNASYWASRIVPLSNPAVGATVWTGVHNTAGKDYYVVFTTAGPPQVNLRLSYFGVFAEADRMPNGSFAQDKAYALRSRPVAGKGEWAYWTVEPKRELSNGQDMRLIISYFNQNTGARAGLNVKSADAGFNNGFPVDVIVRHDSKVGQITDDAQLKIEGALTYENKKTLAPDEAVWFDVPYKAGQSPNHTAKKQVEIIAAIPDEFYKRKLNIQTEDDKLHIVLPIVGENLKPEFVEYRKDGGKTTKVVPGEPYTAVYKLIKTSKGSSKLKVEDARLVINAYDDGPITRVQTNTYSSDGVAYDKKGKEKPRAELVEAGDYTLHEVTITPANEKICSQGMIDNNSYKDLSPNPNDYLEDDKTDINCMENDLNLVVSNVLLIPDTIVLPNGTTTEYKTYTLKYKLTNYNLAGRDLTPLLVYTVNGTQQRPLDGSTSQFIAAGKTITIQKQFGNNVTVGRDYKVQVEVNPNTSSGRLIKEKTSSGANAYADNIGYDILKVKTDKNVCLVNHTQNNWTQGFSVSHTNWYTAYYYEYDYYYDSQGNLRSTRYRVPYTASETYSEYLGPYSFYEKLSLTSLEFTTIGVGSEQDKTYNMLNETPKIKAGQGFSIKLKTLYQSNANIESDPDFVDNGGDYAGNPRTYYVRGQIGQPGGYLRVASPDYRGSENYNTNHEVYIKLKYGGQQYALDTNLVASSGTSQNKSRTFEPIENENGTNYVFVSPDTKDGTYSLKLETSGFFGSPVKTNYVRDLCINRTFNFEVTGSTNDDVHTHINNDFR